MEFQGQCGCDRLHTIERQRYHYTRRDTRQTLDQLHSNHMGIDKPGLLTCKSIYWVNMNVNIENTITLLLIFNRYSLKRE